MANQRSMRSSYIEPKLNAAGGRDGGSGPNYRHAGGPGAGAVKSLVRLLSPETLP